MGTGKKGAAASDKLWFGFACFLIATSSCRQSDTDMPGNGVASVPAPVVSGNTGAVTSDAFKVLVTSPTGKAPYKYFLHAQGAPFSSGSCAVSPGTTSPNNDLYCLVDVAEMDLYFNGISLEFNSPPGMCPYTAVRLYNYWALQAGSVPNPTICTVVTDTGNGSVTQSCTAGSNLTWNGAAYTCNFDYSTQDGPNCCEGQYTLITGKTESGTTKYDSPVTVKMAGKLSNCLAGPGKDMPGFQLSDGYPARVNFSSAEGKNRRLDFAAPISFPRTSNLYLGNYWDPTDFQRVGPGTETGSFPPAFSNDLPKAFQMIGNYTPMPYYEFRCLDAADDTVARIRVLIRSWDTVSSFTANSNPYTDPTTKEPGFNSEYYKNDRSAWTDFSPTHTNARYGDNYLPDFKY